ncbi:DUF4142 domain-containing protein [Streptomyces lichenis]|uniref:DUF4142 domain-containing protein n=1 Tax=Streptomyces lichenis TaxID=2306967 RepID=A0ABT0IB33_9ACTN|nr:DUF4142 domain-containing protein [Streptomyces lichenis]MCK8678525.1 DUF4142 domain-containing protein [Streptomyces lichenis]
MRSHLLTSAVAAAALTGLCAPAFAAAPGATQDQTFLVQSHQGNLAEIAAGKDAGKHATTTCVKVVGKALVRDHTKLDTAVRKLAADTNTALPTAPTAAQQKQLKAVQAKAGSAAYDTAWLKAQDAAHRKTLAVIDKEIDQGSNDSAVAAARSARPVVAMHLDMVRDGTCDTMAGHHTS